MGVENVSDLVPEPVFESIISLDGFAQSQRSPATPKEGTTMPELLVDFITSLDGYGAAEGWPGWWGLQSPEYLGWLGEQPEYTILMGANTYRLMYGFTSQAGT